MLARIGLIMVLGIVCPATLVAQLDLNEFGPKYDTNYVRVYKNELTTRVFVSRKQNGYNLAERFFSPWIKYRTNDRLSLGIGYTYSFMTLNFSVPFPFINTDDDIYGESRYLDLQAHTYFRNFIVDFYLQFNKGYYLSNPEDVYPLYRVSQEFSQRGDLRTNVLGLNIQYLFNSQKYSYKAAFVQNEFQKRSAGTPLLGLEGYWVLGMADSVLVSGDIPPVGFNGDREFNQVDMLNIGVNGGYAYTFVWRESLYISLSSSFGISLGRNALHYTPTSTSSVSKYTLGLTNSMLVSLGYNNNRYYVGLSYVRLSVTNMVGDGGWLGYNSGSLRFNVVRRFITKRPIRILRPDLWVF
jgi:hypothetical protein